MTAGSPKAPSKVDLRTSAKNNNQDFSYQCDMAASTEKNVVYMVKWYLTGKEIKNEELTVGATQAFLQVTSLTETIFMKKVRQG